MKIVFKVVLFWSAIFAFGLSGISDAQISPATRPHTHSGQSSGGSTLNPANLTVTGTLTAPTLSATTSVVTPLVGTDAAVNLIFKAGGTNRWNILNSSGTLFPTTDAGPNLGGATARINTLYTTSIDSGTIGSGTLKTNNGTTVLTWANDLSTTFAGTVDSTKACATNYTRIGPNFCLQTTTFTGTAINAGCNTVAAPSGAKAVLLQITMFVNGANVLNQLDSIIIDSSDSACANLLGRVEIAAKEMVAENNVTIIGAVQQMIAPVFSTNFFLNSATVGGAGSNANFKVTGYYD